MGCGTCAQGNSRCRPSWRGCAAAWRVRACAASSTKGQEMSESPDACCRTRRLPDYLATWAYLPRMPGWIARRWSRRSLWERRRLMRWAVSRFEPGQNGAAGGPCMAISRTCWHAVWASRVVWWSLTWRRSRSPTRAANSPACQAELRVADLVEPIAEQFDAVCCFFLLTKFRKRRRRIVANLLGAVKARRSGGVCGHHRPQRWHPGAGDGAGIRWLEPFAPSLLDTRSSRWPRGGQ